MASNKHAQIRYKVLDDCFSNFRRKFYFDDLIERCNEALRELYGEEHTGIKTRTLRADISYIRDRAGEAGVEVEVKDDGNGYYYRYSEPDFSIFKRGLGEDDLAQLKETILMLQRFKGMPNFDWMSELVVKLEDKFNLRGVSRSVVGYDENKAYTGLDWFQDLFDAIINKCVLHVQYKTFTDMVYDWTIHPYYIKEYNNRWFLFGLNEEQHTIYNIPLDRIENLEQINKEYIPSDIDFETYLDDVVGVSVFPREKEPIRLQFSEHRFPYVSFNELLCRYFSRNIATTPLELNEDIQRNYKEYGELAKYAFQVPDGTCFIRHWNEGDEATIGEKDSNFISVVLYYTFVNGGMMSETQNKAILKEGTRYIRDYYKSLFEDAMKESFFRRLKAQEQENINEQNTMTQIISMEECEQIGCRTEDKVFDNIVAKLNQRHQSATGLSYFDQLSVDLSQSEEIMQDSFPDAYAEIQNLMHEEYRALDELEQHCLFIYLFTNDKDENEIVESMSWHFEEWMEDRAFDFLTQANTDKKLLN